MQPEHSQSHPHDRRDVEVHSAVFKKELGQWDLVLTQILFIVGMGWIGTAGKLGGSHVSFWLLAIVLFYIPSAVVVIHLNRRMPLEGGLYQWAKFGFNEFTGFLVAWNLWLYAMVLMSEVGLQSANNIAYALGPSAEWMAHNKWMIALWSFGIIGGLMLVSSAGLTTGKWVHNAGALAMLAMYAAIAGLAVVHWLRGERPANTAFALTLPPVTLLSLNLLGKMGFAALGGFEYVAIFAGECKDPVKTIGRSVWIAAPIIAAMFILGTGAVLTFVPVDQIDLVSPSSQVLSVGSRMLGVGTRIVPVVLVLLLGIRVAQASINFSATIRLPMVAGWDDLLPKWFTKLHPKFRTPTYSILFVGAMTLALGLAGNSGVGNQEAFQILNNGSGIFYAIPYLVMFAIPLVGHAPGVRPGGWVRLACLSGFGMTLLYVVLSVFPIITVESALAFALKVGGLILVANIVGVAVFVLARRQQAASA